MELKKEKERQQQEQHPSLKKPPRKFSKNFGTVSKTTLRSTATLPDEKYLNTIKGEKYRLKEHYDTLVHHHDDEDEERDETDYQ